jgi:amino acid transporter
MPAPDHSDTPTWATWIIVPTALTLLLFVPQALADLAAELLS